MGRNSPKILVAGDDSNHKEGYYFIASVGNVGKPRVGFRRINNIQSDTGEILESLEKPREEVISIEELSRYQRGEPIVNIEPESSLAGLIKKAKIRAGRNLKYLLLSGISYEDEIIDHEPQLSIPENIETSILRRVKPNFSRKIEISSITPYLRNNQSSSSL